MKRIISAVLSACAFVYTVWYMHFGTPYENSGALSKIGLEHHNLFVVWGVLTYTALAYGIVLCYKKYNKTWVYIPLLIASAVGMALTLAFDFDYDIKPDYYFHCVGSLLFSVVMGITVFLFFALNFKKDFIFKMFALITAEILLVDLVLLIIYKETALIEVLPVFAGYIMLNITIFRRDRIEAVR